MFRPALAVLAAALAAEPSASDVEAWLTAVDTARNAFGEAKIQARASQIENGRSPAPRTSTST